MIKLLLFLETPLLRSLTGGGLLYTLLILGLFLTVSCKKEIEEGVIIGRVEVNGQKKVNIVNGSGQQWMGDGFTIKVYNNESGTKINIIADPKPETPPVVVDKPADKPVEPPPVVVAVEPPVCITGDGVCPKCKTKHAPPVIVSEDYKIQWLRPQKDGTQWCRINVANINVRYNFLTTLPGIWAALMEINENYEILSMEAIVGSHETIGGFPFTVGMIVKVKKINETVVEKPEIPSNIESVNNK